MLPGRAERAVSQATQASPASGPNVDQGEAPAPHLADDTQTERRTDAAPSPLDQSSSRRRVGDEAKTSLDSLLSPGRFDVLDDESSLTELERLEREVEAQHAALVRIGLVGPDIDDKQ